MAKYRLDSIAQLSRQMLFAPPQVRSVQVDRAEELLHTLDAAKAYPLDFVIYRITDYRPKASAQELLTGLALQHDLGLLIEEISASLSLASHSLAEPVLAIDDLCEKFNVTSKTIQRWRRKGLPARRFIYPDGRQRVGFLLSSVERFLTTHREQAAAANVSQVDQAECNLILRHARRLAARCCMDEIARRIARITRRSPLTILHTLRKHDQENPAQAIAPADPLSREATVCIIKLWRRGTALSEIARELGLPNQSVYRVINDARIERLSRRKVRFHDDPLYHQPDAADAIKAIVTQEELAEQPHGEAARVPRDLPPYLQDLYRTPLLTPGKERALFLKFNFHKYQFVQIRRKIDPQLVRNRELRRLETCLALAQDTKNSIVRANLRLVVSVARKHVRPAINLNELISDGNVTLMRAVEGFDIARGHRFSTYATLALMKGFARSVPQLQAATRQTMADPEMLCEVADSRPTLATTIMVQRDQVRHLLSRLDERERSVLTAHFGLDQQTPSTYQEVGERLGLSKERVRQIERTALAKLRTASSV